jgi:carbonic anhydrase/acetyltransferase-like protein (isoleucine patch superfamily)
MSRPARSSSVGTITSSTAIQDASVCRPRATAEQHRAHASSVITAGSPAAQVRTARRRDSPPRRERHRLGENRERLARHCSVDLDTPR